MRVLIVEDDALYREELRDVLAGAAGVEHLEDAADVEAAEAALAAHPPPDLVLLDVHLPRRAGAGVVEVAGPGLARAARVAAPGARVMIISGIEAGEAAGLMLEQVADDFVSKEQPMAEVRARVLAQLREARRRKAAGPGPRLAGISEAMKRVRATIHQAAASPAPVLVTGESGCGKELVAAALHAASPRAGGPFLPFHPSAIAESLLDAELFGHAKGAFTGAAEARAGVVEAAAGGTLFLDEIGELPPPFQVKLLRFLEDGSYFRLGESTPRRADVRLVFATNRDLAAEVEAGRFREDLRYRLEVLRVHVPPLRDRPEDVPVIATDLLARLARSRGAPPPRLGQSAARALQDHGWPGNVRELRNVLERVLLGDVPAEIDGSRVVAALGGFSKGGAPRRAPRAGPVGTGLGPSFDETRRLKDAVGDFEGEWIRQALEAQDGNVSRAATALGVARRTLQEKMRRYGIPAGKPGAPRKK